jgi:hypothetical protein
MGLGNLYCEALRVSRNHIRQELRHKGIRLSSFKASEVTAFAKAFLEANRQELISRAMTDLVWAKLVANLKTSEKKSKARSAGLSAVQMSGSKVEAEL